MPTIHALFKGKLYLILQLLKSDLESRKTHRKKKSLRIKLIRCLLKKDIKKESKHPRRQTVSAVITEKTT